MGIATTETLYEITQSNTDKKLMSTLVFSWAFFTLVLLFKQICRGGEDDVFFGYVQVGGFMLWGISLFGKNQWFKCLIRW